MDAHLLGDFFFKFFFMCTTKQYYANTGLVTINTPNGNLDGTGTLGTVLTGANTGTEIRKVIVKALGNVGEGIVRLFVDDGINIVLIKEILVPAQTQTSVEKSFEAVILDPIILQPGYILKASTQKNDTFNVIAFGNEWNQCPCATSSEGCCSDLKTVSNSEINQIDAGNSSLDGSGPIVTILTSPSAPLDGGTTITFVNVKAVESTTQGMVRLFIDDGVNKYLFKEIPIPSNVKSFSQPTFRTTHELSFNLKSGYSLCASTENSEPFNILFEGTDYSNCTCAS